MLPTGELTRHRFWCIHHLRLWPAAGSLGRRLGIWWAWRDLQTHQTALSSNVRMVGILNPGIMEHMFYPCLNITLFQAISFFFGKHLISIFNIKFRINPLELLVVSFLLFQHLDQQRRQHVYLLYILTNLDSLLGLYHQKLLFLFLFSAYSSDSAKSKHADG